MRRRRGMITVSCSLLHLLIKLQCSSVFRKGSGASRRPSSVKLTGGWRIRTSDLHVRTPLPYPFWPPPAIRISMVQIAILKWPEGGCLSVTRILYEITSCLPRIKCMPPPVLDCMIPISDVPLSKVWGPRRHLLDWLMWMACRGRKSSDSLTC